jgi:16S rRNA (cytosine967-C5)-methyltransferase
VTSRRIALAALNSWRSKTQFADSIISELLAKARLGAADCGFAIELFYGVLRNLTLLDFWVGALRRGYLDAALREILRLGLYQLLILKTPEYAAVNETVELAPGKQRSLINGILRAATRRGEQLQQGADRQPLHVRFSHPKFLVQRWRKSFGDAAIDLCKWNNQPPPTYARINQLKISPTSFFRAYPKSFGVPAYPTFVEKSELPRRAIEQGECYIQDPSTVMACNLVGPKPGEKILDACAAPGGKTGYLAERMENCGTIVACDRDLARVELLRKNLSQLGVAIAQIFQHDWEKSPIPPEILSTGPFDRILVDAPCSNTGVMRRRVDVRWRLRPKDFVLMQRRQVAIVKATSKLLKPGGVLVYSTCSLEREENEGVVESICTESSCLRPDKEDRIVPFREGFDGAFAARLLRTC